MCTFAIIRTFIVNPAEDYKSSLIVKFETTINDRIDFHKEEPIPRNTDLFSHLSFGIIVNVIITLRR